ncbi:hypothetical protein [Cellvibrio sp. NN19]|uniref:hypothetical protein n=1 Tax=Cellvibrio chitinivorans TaxID=3102792 RepID=UPI002B413C2B|nr:hypothetical protein [Cellvibrio sp. NN19]
MGPLKELAAFLVEHQDPATEEYKNGISKHIKMLEKLGLSHEIHFTNEEIKIKLDSSGGGYKNIGFIEDRYADLVRSIEKQH